MKQKRKTNTQLVKDIMTNSHFGALSQLFVMDALQKLADAVAESRVSDYPKNGFVHPEAWIGVAKEIQKKLKDGDA